MLGFEKTYCLCKHLSIMKDYSNNMLELCKHLSIMKPNLRVLVQYHMEGLTKVEGWV